MTLRGGIERLKAEVGALEAEVLGLREVVARLQARVEQGGLKWR